MGKEDKIIVVGAGVFGLSMVMSLLENGYTDIHLFDKRDYVTSGYTYFKGCDSPSSDINKIFRTVYGEETYYEKLAFKTRETFLKWNKMIKEENFEGGEPLYLQIGNCHLTDLVDLPEVEATALQNMLPTQVVCISDGDAEERAIKAGLSKHAIDPFRMKERGCHHQGLLEFFGGEIVADKACRWFLKQIISKGGSNLTLHLGANIGEIEEILKEEIESNNGDKLKRCIGIKTKDGLVHRAKKTIVGAGPWIPEIVPEAGEKIEATGGTVCLIKIDDPIVAEKYGPKNFPNWTWRFRKDVMGCIYGFPVRNGYMKIGYRGLKWTNPRGSLNSKVKTAYSDEKETNVPLFGLNLVKKFIKENIPEIKKIDMTRLCWYGDTCDNDFLIDYVPGYIDDSLFVMGGDSGHAFMMIKSIGDVCLGILEKRETSLLTNLFSWSRVREKKNIINAGAYDPRALVFQKMATPAEWVID